MLHICFRWSMHMLMYTLASAFWKEAPKFFATNLWPKSEVPRILISDSKQQQPLLSQHRHERHIWASGSRVASGCWSSYRFMTGMSGIITICKA